MVSAIADEGASRSQYLNTQRGNSRFHSWPGLANVLVSVEVACQPLVCLAPEKKQSGIPVSQLKARGVVLGVLLVWRIARRRPWIVRAALLGVAAGGRTKNKKLWKGR